ncbi:hypothetical protein B0H10DRAFT_1025351 [Mycena sp. CBHHK59/15]|nr:hypothetical protein B0H10DRAFT_1025351 [Mycena sp. CBHHK59/15]
MSAHLSGETVHDAAHRIEMIRQWAVDCQNLAALTREQLTTAQAELELSRCENTALRSELEVSKADSNAYRTDSLWLGGELTCREEMINAQNAVIKRLQDNNVDNNVDVRTYQLLVESSRQLRAHLGTVESQLLDQKNAYIDLQQKMDEQRVREKELQAEIVSLRNQARHDQCVCTQANPAYEYVQTAPGNLTPAAQPVVAPQVTAAPSSSSTTITQPNAVASPSKGPSTAVPVAKTEPDEDDIIIVQSENPESFLTPIPESRSKELQEFPEFVPDSVDSMVLSRGHLATRIGGNIQGVIARSDTSRICFTLSWTHVLLCLLSSISDETITDLAVECNVRKYLCPNLTMNPWCPTSPGQHGYMFVGLGRENNTFLQPEHLSLFLSVPPLAVRSEKRLAAGRKRPHTSDGSSRLEVTYLGLYEVCRVAPLTIAEWKTLSSCVRFHGSFSCTIDVFSRYNTSTRLQLQAKGVPRAWAPTLAGAPHRSALTTTLAYCQCPAFA